MIRLLMKLAPLAILGFAGVKGVQQIMAITDTAKNMASITVVKHEIANFITKIAIEHQAGDGIPRNFKTFAREHFRRPEASYKDVWEDPWLNDYNYWYRRNGCKISSSGPDSIKGSRDDIVGRYGKF